MRKRNYCDFFCVVFGAEMVSCVSVWSQSFHKLVVSARCLHTKKPWKLGPCPVLLGASLCCKQGFMCKLKHGLLLNQFWLAMQFSWSDHLLIISCSLREIEFSPTLCIPRGSLKAILCVWHLSVGAFVVICPVTSIPTAGKNPSIHLHKTYLTWTSGQQNFSQAACVA